VATDEEGMVFTESTQTDWDYEFEVKYSDFPFLVHIMVTNNDPGPGNAVDVEVYREDTVVASTVVDAGDMDAITTSVSY